MGEKKILVYENDKTTVQAIGNILAELGYVCQSVSKLTAIHAKLSESKYLAVILDIDDNDIDNRMIRNFSLKYPGICMLGTSRNRYHPEMKDAICYYLYGYLHKPIDHEELYFFLNCIDTEFDHSHVEEKNLKKSNPKKGEL